MTAPQSRAQNPQPVKLKQTALHDWHADNGGRMVDFAGWSMPVQYGSIIDEHRWTRNAVGLFDVSHMARLAFPESTAAIAGLEKLTTRRINSLQPGQIRYSLLTRADGGILDDVLVYCLPLDTPVEFMGAAAGNESLVMMVANASNRQQVIDWLSSKNGVVDLNLDDRTESTSMLAVQGPKANRLVARLCATDPETLPYYGGTTTSLCDRPVILTRTGYTGEDGCEIIVHSDHALELWTRLHTAAQTEGGGACGLAARDTLRLEAAMPLYGHELSESINAAQTKLGFAIQLKERTFPGRDAIAAAIREKNLPVRVGLELDGKRAARETCPILHEDLPVGTVTSGTFGPTIQKSISMGYVLPDFSKPGTELSIDIRGKIHSACVFALPFYQRGQKNS